MQNQTVLDRHQQLKNVRESEENYLNLWTYLKRRYPETDLESKCFSELMFIKSDLEGPRSLRDYGNELAFVRRR